MSEEKGKSSAKRISTMLSAPANAASSMAEGLASAASGRVSPSISASRASARGSSSNSPSNTQSDERRSGKSVFKQFMDPLKQVADTANPLTAAKRAARQEKKASGKKPLLADTSHIDRVGDDDVDDDAEHVLLSTIENRARNTTQGADGFRAAVEGEVPPLGVDNLGVGLSDSPSQSSKDGARAAWMNTLKLLRSQKLIATSSDDVGHHHRRAHTLLTANDEEKKDGGADGDFGFFTKEGEDLDAYDAIFDPSETQDGSDGSVSESLDGDAMPSTEDNPHERLPLLRGEDGPEGPPTPISRSVRQAMARRMVLQRQWKAATECLNPLRIGRIICYWFTHSVMIPALLLFTVAWVLYYYAGNPSLDFLPGKATVSWWMNFAGRQLLVLEIARFCEFMFVDCLVMSTRFVARMLGSWVTYFCIQSKGWPFVVGAWGVLDMIVLQGDNEFQLHWLYWTGIGIYSSANSGSYVLSSDRYLRLLISMLLAGFLTTLKRTVLTLYFGRRKFETYKPRLEEILNDVILISDVAELSAEAGNIAEAIGLDREDSVEELKAHVGATVDLRKKRPAAVRWSSVRFSKGNADLEGSDVAGDADGDADEERDTAEAYKSQSAFFSGSSFSSSRHLPIRDLLIKWEEPVSKRDKTFNATVTDILKFRKALTYMDLEYPFAEAFGPASTRNEMVTSAELVYERLMRLSPKSVNLSFSIFHLLAVQEDGTEDKEKEKALKALFRPNAKDELTLLSFVQACDTVYKKLRFLRASVGNASVIDQVLELIIDTIFYFVIGLVILSFLKMNPWPLLVSMSTLLVTASFAVGPSAAKAIEGILLIVSRRPFDIGDRIIISDNPGGPMPGMGLSWFVEDISLFSTSLRSAISNEVATISNGSIANSRITNCARSKNAVINFVLKFHISCHHGKLIDKFRRGVDRYLEDNPQIWDSVAFFRCEDVDTDREMVSYRLGMRSRYTWQVAPRVLQKQGELHTYCVALSDKLGISYDSPNDRSILYYGGSLMDGGRHDYKGRVLSNDNIVSNGTFDVNEFSQREGLPSSSHQSESASSYIESTKPSRTQSPNDEEDVDDQPRSETDIADDNADKQFLAMLQQSHR